MQYKIRGSLMHHLYYAVPKPYVTVRVTSSAILLQNRAVSLVFCSPLSVSLERSCWPCIRWCGTGWVKEQAQCFFYWPKLLVHVCLLLFSRYLLLSMRWYCEAGVFGVIGCKSRSLSLAMLTTFNNNSNNNNNNNTKKKKKKKKKYNI